MDSSRRSMSRSAESEAPTAFSCSSRCMRSATGSAAAARLGCELSSRVLTGALLDADRADFLDMRDAGQALLHAVLLQRAHAVFQALGEHLGDARMLLDQLLQLVRGDEQLVQAAAALEAAAAALVAADRL